MRKIILLPGIIFLGTSFATAQTKSLQQVATVSKVKQPDQTAVTKNDSVYTKIPLPTNQKNGPAIFYIKNDKPVNIPVIHTSRSGN